LAKIAHIHAREVLDSRGNPTVEVEVRCADGATGRAIVPSGASTGTHEAMELRDGGARFGGKGVRRAVENVSRIIGPALRGHDVADQKEVDRLLCELDGTPNKSKLGGNATLGVSLAVAHAAAASQRVALFRYLDPKGRATLPLPMVNMISGGLHAGGNLEFQDFLLLPIGANSYSQALEMSVRVYQALGKLLMRAGYEAALVGDEGGYGPKLRDNEHAIQLLVEAIAASGLEPGRDAAVALDVASTQFFRDGQYRLEGGTLSTQAMITRLCELAERYPILSVEDGLAEDDWEGWRQLTAALGQRVQLVGDDLFTTNPARLGRGICEQVANCVLVKPNQIGTLSETLAAIRQAEAQGYGRVISARSGETEDTTIADLAVGTATGQIKIGCIVRGERLAKYNQLLRIEDALGPNAPFAGRSALPC
jgi:enolase 1/2/3